MIIAQLVEHRPITPKVVGFDTGCLHHKRYIYTPYTNTILGRLVCWSRIQGNVFAFDAKTTVVRIHSPPPFLISLMGGLVYSLNPHLYFPISFYKIGGLVVISGSIFGYVLRITINAPK